MWQMQQYNMPPINLDLFNMDGMQLCSLSLDEFGQRSCPSTGELLFAQLDIWKTVLDLPVPFECKFTLFFCLD